MDCRNRRAGRAFALVAGFFLLACGRAAAEADRDHPRERAEWNAQLRRDASGKVLSEHRLKALRDAQRLLVDPSMRTPGSGIRSLESPAAAWQSIGPRPIQS